MANRRAPGPVILSVLMLANPRMPWQVSMPPYVRVALFGLVVGALLFFLLFSSTVQPVASPEPRPELTVLVPKLDPELLARAKDDDRRDRLLLEPEPFAHALAKAIDVSPAAARAMGMPAEPVPVAELRRDRERHRGAWLWYKGVLEDLTGPKTGHPVEGHSIYEARVRLLSGERVFAAFSLPPGADVKEGGFVRVEGFLLKLRDTNYPEDVREAPLLVGREIVRDYADWPKVLELDPSLLAGIDDSDYQRGAKPWDRIDDDQDVPLWHLAAYARDTEPNRGEAEWAQRPVLNAMETLEQIKAGTVARGTPMRILGTLVKIRGVAAKPNPAGIDFWTVAYVQCPDLAAHIVPIWVPKDRLDVPLNTDLEVHGYYYRWFAYTSIEDIDIRIPLFVAPDLDLYDVKVDETMQSMSILVTVAIAVLFLVITLSQWGARRASRRHSEQMDARRRRRREKAAAANP